MNCEKCKAELNATELANSNYVCSCGNYLKISARQRIEQIADAGSFTELDGNLISVDRLGFYQYPEKLDAAKKASGENEAVICGIAKICGVKCCIFVMESAFMMGSMGAVVGEKIAKLFEYAAGKGLSVVGFSASGGARMQEGMISLMQMAKTNGAVKYHSDRGGFYLSVLTNPTTGGVTASFAAAGDVIIAEPQSLIGFAGQRVIKQTVGQDLPEGFQTAEFTKEKGMIDEIVPRQELKEYIGFMLGIHGGNA